MRRGGAIARASLLGLALASCALDVTLGAGGKPVTVEQCGDRLDNNGNGLVDEGCVPGKNCRLPMDARAVGSCGLSLGFAWDGRQCVELLGCGCLGSRCASLYDTYLGCKIDKELCESPGDVEICGDGLDNDRNGLVDENCPTPCPPMARDASAPPPESCPDVRPLGYAWDGNTCVEVIGCGCEGPGCLGLAPDLASCLEKNSQCIPWTCQPPVPDVPPDGGPAPSITYESFDPGQCQKLGSLPCGPGSQFFSNECGCGCAGLPAPDPNFPLSVTLHASSSPAECEARKLLCFNPSGRVEGFSDSSGCGCLYKAECPELDAPGVEFQSTDPRECQALSFECKAPDFVAFRGPCGCGCMPANGLCTMPAEAYALTDPYTCASKSIGCPPDRRSFRDFCGCGCVPLEPADGCPDPTAPGVDYLDATPENFAVCDLLSFECDPGQERFSVPLCGCGCRPANGTTTPDDPAPGP
jgi:hypothetical protein